MQILEIIGAVLTLLGSIFMFLGSLGLVRMPDVFNRIQAGTKASTLGTILSLMGIALIHPTWGGKIVLIIISVIITNPVSSSVIARAAHFTGIPLSKKTVTDRLKEDRDAGLVEVIEKEEETV